MNRKYTCAKTAALLLSAAVLTACSQGADSTRTVYEDMETDFEQSGLLSANIGIMTKTTDGDSVTYGSCGSGVIIEKEDGIYYALTCAHVVSTENAEFLVFTVSNDMHSETVPGTDIVILDEEAYEAMYTAEVVMSAPGTTLPSSALRRMRSSRPLPSQKATPLKGTASCASATRRTTGLRDRTAL